MSWGMNTSRLSAGKAQDDNSTKFRFNSFPIKSAEDSIYVYYISCLLFRHFAIESDGVIIISS